LRARFDGAQVVAEGEALILQVPQRLAV